MPSILINEIDNTTYLNREITNDNIVVVFAPVPTAPANDERACTGEGAYICYNLSTFYNQFGKAPTGATIEEDDDGSNKTYKEGSEGNALYWEYAANLIRVGFPVLYIQTNDASKWMSTLADKIYYKIKFIPTIVDALTMTTDGAKAGDYVNLAETRGDALALVDYDYEEGRIDPTDSDNYIGKLCGNINSSYAAVVYPGATMTSPLTNVKLRMPPSFWLLKTMAEGVRSGSPIYSIWAGAKRGVITGIDEYDAKVSTQMMESWTDGEAIIPLMYIPPYGDLIYGNNTRKTPASYEDPAKTGDPVTVKRSAKKSALDSLNVRITANEIKRAIYETCLGLTFDTNDFILWNEFKTQMSVVLDAMKEARAINDYLIIMDESYTGGNTDPLTVPGCVKVDIARAAEHFDINFELTPAGAALSEQLD